MIYLSLCLLLLGAVLLCVEAFIPGFGIVGASGVAIIIVSSIITAFTVPFGPYIVICEIIILTIAIFLLLRFFRKKEFYSKLILSETLNKDESSVGDLDYYIGKEGITKTSLRPFGTVDFDGVTVEAYSDGSYIDARKHVVVTEIKQKRIMVKSVNGAMLSSTGFDTLKN